MFEVMLYECGEAAILGAGLSRKYQLHGGLGKKTCQVSNYRAGWCLNSESAPKIEKQPLRLLDLRKREGVGTQHAAKY